MGICLTFRNNNIRSVFLMTLLLGFTLFPMKSFGLYDPPVIAGFSVKKISKPGEQNHMRLNFVSKLSLKDLKIFVKVPPVGLLAAEEKLIWAENQKGPFSQEFFYDTPPLPPGQYVFEAVFEFTAPDEAKIPMKIGKHTVVAVNSVEKERTYRITYKAYFDVRSRRVYVGGLSFEDIEKRELIMEIRLKSGKGKDFYERELWKLPINELEKMNGGPWKDKHDHHGKPDK